MTDIVSSQKRSEMMSGIRSRDTKPEMQLRRWLHSQGFRYRLHLRTLPGSPDLVLPKFRVAIFVHGCFWHRHQGCRFATMPATRTDVWQAKFAGNQARDARDQRSLLEEGWRVLVVWECGLRGRRDISSIAVWIEESVETYAEWPFE